MTSRLLLEARGGLRQENYSYNATPGRRSVSEVDHRHRAGLGQRRSAGLMYHGGGIGGADAHAAVSEHIRPQLRRHGGRLLRAPGLMRSRLVSPTRSCSATNRSSDNDYHVSYRFNSGVPNQITERTTPIRSRSGSRPAIGLFAQDKWTLDRLTLNRSVLRFDYLDIYIPAQHLGPAPLVPARNLDLPRPIL